MTSRRVSSTRKSKTNKSLFIGLLVLFNFGSLVSESSGAESLVDKDKILQSTGLAAKPGLRLVQGQHSLSERRRTKRLTRPTTTAGSWSPATSVTAPPTSGYSLTEFANRPFLVWRLWGNRLSIPDTSSTKYAGCTTHAWRATICATGLERKAPNPENIHRGWLTLPGRFIRFIPTRPSSSISSQI